MARKSRIECIVGMVADAWTLRVPDVTLCVTYVWNVHGLSLAYA